MCLHLIKNSSTHRKAGYSLRGFWGQINHFNKDGVIIGYTVKGFWGGRKRYDMDGNLVSYTLKNFWGGYNTYDADGNLIRRSRKNFFGGYNTYDRQGNKIRESYRNFWEGMNHYDVENPDALETLVFIQNSSASKVNSNVVHHPYGDYQTSAVEPRTVRTEASTESRKPATQKTKEYHAEKPVANYVPFDNGKRIEEPTTVMPDVEHAGVEVESHSKSGTFSGQQLNASVEYLSMEEVLKEAEVSEYARLLIFKYKNLEEFPAVAYIQGNKVKVHPLVRGASEFEFPVTELEMAKEVHVTDIDMGVLDNEFYTLSVSALGKEFEDLLPEYPFGSDGIYRTQYVFECGMAITEKSMYELRKKILKN